LSLCEHLGSLPAPGGATVSIFVATIAAGATDGSCEVGGDHKGVVFYGSEPSSWFCLSDDDEIDEFKAWAAEKFPSVPVAMVAAPNGINCPPPPQAAGSPSPVTTMRDGLKKLAASWFAAKSSTRVSPTSPANPASPT
jgi:hypothetical protein